MPAALERDVRAQARRSHPDFDSWPEERRNAYVYYIMRKRGWRPSQEREKAGTR